MGDVRADTPPVEDVEAALEAEDAGLGPAATSRSESGAGLVRLSTVEPLRVRWLWQGRVPLGRLTLLDGDPGLGKSTLALDLTARVSTGAAMPDGSPGLGDPAGVVLLTAADPQASPPCESGVKSVFPRTGCLGG